MKSPPFGQANQTARGHPPKDGEFVTLRAPINSTCQKRARVRRGKIRIGRPWTGEDSSIALKAAKILPDARIKARRMEGKAEAEALGGAARLEDLHLGSCRKMDAEAALQKARKMKAEALGVRKCTA